MYDKSLMMQESFSIRASSGYETIKSLGDQPSLPIRDPPNRVRVRVFLVRHGESIANTDASVLTKYSDHAIPLSESGLGQAKECGDFLKNFLRQHNSGGKEESSRRRVWVSPYKRARDTGGNASDYDAVLLLLSLFYSFFLFLLLLLLPTATGIINTDEANFSDLHESVFLGEQQFGLFEGLSEEVEISNSHQLLKKDYQ
jgi:bisphosphoglycerate-dependent phosphoglycerate mutase